MKNYLFIIRSYNDIDHFTPILDYILENKMATVHLFSSVPLQLILPNENLEYLKNKYKIEPSYLLQSEGNGLIKFIERTYVGLLQFNTKTLLPKYISIFLNHFIKRMRLWLRKLNEKKLTKNIDDLYDNIRPNLLIYDWTDPSLFPYKQLLAKAKLSGIPTVSIPHGLNVFLNPIMERIRQKHICKNQIQKGMSGMKNLVKKFKNGTSIALMIDQRVSEGIKIKFFEKKAFTTTIPAQFAKKYKTKIVPVYIERLKNDEFKIKFQEPIVFGENESIDTITENLNKIIEKMILNNPGQWIWTHDRWK